MAFVPRFPVGRPLDLERKHHVLEGGEDGDQVESLEYETDRLVAKLAPPVVGKGADIRAVDDKSPSVGSSMAPTRLKRVVLPEPEGPHTATNSAARLSAGPPRAGRALCLPQVVIFSYVRHFDQCHVIHPFVPSRPCSRIFGHGQRLRPLCTGPRAASKPWPSTETGLQALVEEVCQVFEVLIGDRPPAEEFGRGLWRLCPW